MRQQGHANLTQAYMAGISCSLTSIVLFLALPSTVEMSPHNIVGRQCRHAP